MKDHTEDQDQEDRQDEAGHRDADHRDPGRDVVGPAIVAKCREDPQRDTDHDGQRERHQTELERRHEAFADDIVDRPIGERVGRPKIPLEEVADPADVLDGDRVV